MGTKIELIVDHLGDEDAFEAALPELIQQARELPALVRLESGKVWPKEDGTPTPAYRTLHLHFATYDDASEATASEAGYRFFQHFYRAAGEKVTGLFTDIELES